MSRLERPPTPYPGITLPSSFDSYLSGLPSKRRKDLRRHLRRLDDGLLEHHTVEEVAQIDRAVATWQRLRVRWWSARGRRINPEHASPRFRLFMADVLRLLVPIGLARVSEFSVDGRVVAVEIALLDRRRLYAWLDGYDPDFANFGLGKLAVTEAIRWSIDAGLEYFDFMVGDEAYKYSFGARDRYCDWVMFTHGRPKSRLALLASTARARALSLDERRSPRKEEPRGSSLLGRTDKRRHRHQHDLEVEP